LGGVGVKKTFSTTAIWIRSRRGASTGLNFVTRGHLIWTGLNTSPIRGRLLMFLGARPRAQIGHITPGPTFGSSASFFCTSLNES
jgi:hypothetical protein